MIPGRFGNTSSRPYVGGRLLIPRFGLSANLSFLVDTGADRTTLMPADAVTMGLDYRQLAGVQQAGGIGGTAKCFTEPVVLSFHEPNRNLVRSYTVKILIPEVVPSLRNAPSLLGRDVLDGWYMHYDPRGSGLRFTVRRADHTQKV